MRPTISFVQENLRPPELFHYTGAYAFEQIVTCGKLRATNFRYLDDPTEVAYGLELLQPELEQASDTSRSALRAFWQRTSASVAASALSDFYVCCFSGMEDDVSQWRAFGAGAARYAIGFDSDSFYDVASRAGGRFDRVVYKRNKQLDEIRRVIDKARLFLARRRITSAHVEQLAAVAARHLVRHITRFKSPKYAAEKEWRIVVEKPASASDGVSFDSSRGYLRPYISLALAGAEQPLPLLSVWVLAPGRSDSAVKAASLVLNAAKIRDVYARPSAVPLAF
jgi:hypothetical protein